jgi:hypothetical protein
MSADTEIAKRQAWVHLVNMETLHFRFKSVSRDRVEQARGQYLAAEREHERALREGRA